MLRNAHGAFQQLRRWEGCLPVSLPIKLEKWQNITTQRVCTQARDGVSSDITDSFICTFCQSLILHSFCTRYFVGNPEAT